MLENRKRYLALAFCAMLMFEASFVAIASAKSDKEEDEDLDDDDDTPLYANS